MIYLFMLLVDDEPEDLDFTELFSRKGDLNFKTEKGKFQYLEDLLNNVATHTDILLRSKFVKYELMVTRPDGEKVYFHEGIGRPLSFGCGGHGIYPFDLFVRDLVCLRSLLQIDQSRSEEASEFDDHLVNYAIYLNGKGVLPPPEIVVTNADERKIQEALKDIQWVSLNAASQYIERVQTAFYEIWLPKLEEHTGKYDPNHLKQELYLGHIPLEE
jgi:hypothetical protein